MKKTNLFTIELIWNREFHYSPYGRLYTNKQDAINAAISIRDSGDGARVKKCRVLNEQGEVVWNG